MGTRSNWLAQGYFFVSTKAHIYIYIYICLIDAGKMKHLGFSGQQTLKGVFHSGLVIYCSGLLLLRSKIKQIQPSFIYFLLIQELFLILAGQLKHLKDNIKVTLTREQPLLFCIFGIKNLFRRLYISECGCFFLYPIY